MAKGSPVQTFSKRVAFLISDQSLIQNGGIGQFTKAFALMAKDLGWAVDLILDKKPRSEDFIAQFRDCIDRIVAPTVSLPYSSHSETFAFTDSVNFEKQLNFRNAFMLACQDVMYDLIVCNVPETYIPVYSTGLYRYIPTIFYTHNESMIGLGEDGVGPYSKEYVEVFKRMFTLPGIFVATQSQSNAQRLEYMGVEAQVLPMPLSEPTLQEPSTDHIKTGVLYIGRWEERKNPLEYLRIIKETGLPAKVMTNRTGGGKFESAFKKMGITDYHIAQELGPKEKVDFIKSARVFYNPALKEAFCYTMIEVLGHAHVVALSEYDWSVEFSHYPNVHRVFKAGAAALVKKLYATEPDPLAPRKVKIYHDVAVSRWWNFVTDHKIIGSPKNRSEVSKKDDIWYDDHIDSLQRFASVEDLEVCYKACGPDGFGLVHAPSRTWLTTNNTVPSPVESRTCEDIFG